MPHATTIATTVGAEWRSAGIINSEIISIKTIAASDALRLRVTVAETAKLETKPMAPKPSKTQVMLSVLKSAYCNRKGAMNV